MSRFWEIVFCVSLRFRHHVCLSNLKHAPSPELPLTARKTVFRPTEKPSADRHIFDNRVCRQQNWTDLC